MQPQLVRDISSNASSFREAFLNILELFGSAQGKIDRLRWSAAALMEREERTVRPSVLARPSLGQDGPGEGEALHGLELLHAPRGRQRGRRGDAAAPAGGNGWERSRGGVGR